MRRYLIYVVMICAAFGLVTATVRYVPARAVHAPIITVGAVHTGQPYLYTLSSGEKVGYNVDVLNLLSEELGITFVIIEGETEHLLKQLQNGVLDLVMGVQHNGSHVEALKYAQPFIKNRSRIFVKSSNTTVSSFDDLEGKVVAVYKHDPSMSYVKTLKGVRVFKTDTLEDAASLVAYGTVDAWVGNERESVLLVQGAMYAGNIKQVGVGVETFPSGIAGSKWSDDLIEAIDSGLETIRDSEALRAIEDKWFGTIVVKDYSVLKKYLYATLAIALAVTTFFFMTMRINRLLKKEVERRTREILFQKKLSTDMLQSLSEAVVTIDASYTVLFVNGRFKSLFPNVDLIVNESGWEGLSRILSQNDLKKGLMGTEKIECVEKRLNGGERIFSYTINPIELSLTSGEIERGVTVVVRDQTSQVVLKERMAQIDKLQSIGRMTADIAHEIRNPLASINAYISILPEKYDNMVFRETMVSDLTSEIRRINDIVHNLLTYSKIKKTEPECFDLRSEVAAILRLLDRQVHLEHIEIVQCIAPQLYVWFDKNHFTQVCVNILANALDKLQGEGGGMIVVSGTAVVDGVRLEFKDSGVSIDENEVDSIFAPFFSTKESGTGLGLSIVEELVSKNDGTIKVYNSDEGMVVFELKLKGGTACEKITNC